MNKQTKDFQDASTGRAFHHRARRWASVAIDVLISGLALVILSPLMLVIVAALLVEIGWPVIYSQTRVGEGGRPFRIFKFRKFHVPNDAPGPLLTLRDDARMSRIGRILERSKLDELPQFWNVLIGDMAMVGPRPQNEISEGCFTSEYRALLRHRPGIFGPGQVAFRSEGSLYPPGVDRHAFYRETIFPLKAQLDLAYYPRRTLFSDMRWIIRGILAVLKLHPTIRDLSEAAPGGIVAEGRTGWSLQRFDAIVSPRELVDSSARGTGSV